MRHDLDPEHDLAPATIEAIRDLLGAPPAATVDDGAVLQVAMGIADAPTRLACARAVLASPGVLARLLRADAWMAEEIGRSPGQGDLDDLGRLAAFPGPFTAADAAAVFPARFGADRGIRGLRASGWVLENSAGLLVLAPRARTLVHPPSEAGEDEGWRARFVGRHVELAEEIGRTLAEGRWSEGSGSIGVRLPNLREAWREAALIGQMASVREIALALAPALMEMGEREAFADLVAAGRRAADALGNTLFRSWLLSYEGAEAAYRDDNGLARRLWAERLALCREQGHRVAEADTLLDLAGLAQGEGSHAEALALLDVAETVVAEIGRPDYEATIWSHRALSRLADDDFGEAAELARRALNSLEGTDGANFGVFVRLTAARTLVRCGRVGEAIDALGDVLDRCLEAGRPADAAAALSNLGRTLDVEGRAGLAGRALATAHGIRAGLGAKRVHAARAELDAFAARNPEVALAASGDWALDVASILGDLRDSRASWALAR